MYHKAYPKLIPTWLSDVVPYSLSLLLSATAQRAKLGLLARHPSEAPSESLYRIGLDRKLTRGRTETQVGFVRRLLEWRYPQGHRTRGNAFALLRQVFVFFGRANAKLSTCQRNGLSYIRDPAHDPVEYTESRAWAWGGYAATNWARWWLYAENAGIAWHTSIPSIVEGDCVGFSGVTTADVQSVRGIIQGWNPVHAHPEWWALSYTSLEITPASTWNHWGFVTVLPPYGRGLITSARSDDLRYVAMSSDLRTFPSPRVTAWASRFVEVDWEPRYDTIDDATYDAVDEWHSNVQLPNGEYYDAQPDQWHSSITLPDDGTPAV